MSYFNSQFLSSSPIGSFYSLQTQEDVEPEQQPLIASSSPSLRPSTAFLDSRHRDQPSETSRNSTPVFQQYYHSQDESSCLDIIVEKIKDSKVAGFLDNFAVECEPGLTNTQLMLTNHDLKPVEPERRQWGAWSFTGLWIADSFNISTWMISSSMITSAGLSWWQSWLCVWIGYSISGLFVCLTGRIGAKYHIGFSVVTRSSFGIWGSLWPVFNRAVMACVWYGVQASIGGTCVKLMIRSIWSSYEDLPNTMPTSSGTNTRDFVAFLLFWIGSLPAIWLPVHKVRHLFTVKAFIVPVAGVAFFIWAIAKAHGLGPIVQQPSTATGPDLRWAIIRGVMSSIGNFAALIVNNPDFSRFARKPSDALWSQMFTIPIGFAFTSIIGIFVSSSSNVIYGKPVWNPLDLLDAFLEEGDTPTRFGVFIIAASFTLAQLGTNIAANSISAGTDMTAIAPRFLTIRRGGYICATIGLLICPWNLLQGDNQFMTYISAYSVFLSSVAGVIVCDYYLVRKGYIQVEDLYSGRRSGPYFFSYGFHWRAYAAYVAGILINIPGFLGACGWKVPKSVDFIYNFNFFGGFTVSALMYWTLCRVSPIPACSNEWLEVETDGSTADREHDVENTSDTAREERVGKTLIGRENLGRKVGLW
ncbi:uracil permease [Venturia nashicola]|nr:uracil permease [Venturia nashicola]